MTTWNMLSAPSIGMREVLPCEGLSGACLVAVQEVVFDAASIVKGGHINRHVVVSRLAVAEESGSCVSANIKLHTDSFDEVAKLVQCGFRGPLGCGRSEVCGCNVDWRATPAVMLACNNAMDAVFEKGMAMIHSFQSFDEFLTVLYREGGQEKPVTTTPSTINADYPRSSAVKARIRADSDCAAKYAILVKLREARGVRAAACRDICLLQDKLKAKHRELLEVRKRLKVGKFATRNERREVQEESVQVEKEVMCCADTLTATCLRVYEEAHREIKFFCSLFHHGFIPPDNRKNVDEAAPPDPLRMKLDDNDEAAISSVRHDKSVYFELGACEASGDAPLLHRNLQQLPQWPEHYVNFLLESGRLTAPPKKKEEKSSYSSHFLSRSSYRKGGNYHGLKKSHSQTSSGPAKEETSKCSPEQISKQNEKEVKDKQSRNIPGLCKFTVDNVSTTPTYLQSEITKEWSASLSKWFFNMECAWKKDKRTLCLSFLQRARHVLYGGSKYCTLKDSDTQLVRAVERESAFVLMEFLLCRGTLVLRVRVKRPLHVL